MEKEKLAEVQKALQDAGLVQPLDALQAALDRFDPEPQECGTNCDAGCSSCCSSGTANR